MGRRVAQQGERMSANAAAGIVGILQAAQIHDDGTFAPLLPLIIPLTRTKLLVLRIPFMPNLDASLGDGPKSRCARTARSSPGQIDVCVYSTSESIPPPKAA